MITPIAKIAAEVVRQAAQHPKESAAQIHQRVADHLHIEASLVTEELTRPATESEQQTGDASDGCGEGPAGETGDDHGQ